ncbi:MAG TPA: hypothetical protein VH478_03785 [Trebonia sp.]|jgi:hypothetical protein|nr:hypothetical protein [Trebonia sp.]
MPGFRLGSVIRRSPLSYVLLGALLVAASLLGFPRSALAATGADNFQRANGALGSSWTAIADGALTISGDQVVGRSANANSGDLWTASSFGSDQFSQVTTSSTQLSGGQWLGTAVRGQNSGKTGYVGIYNWNSGSPQLMLFKRSNSAWTQLGATKAISALPAGSTLKLAVTGSSLILSANGTATVTATDSSLTGGAPGIMTYQAAHAAAWTGGDATAGSGSGGATTSYTVGGTVSGLAAGSLTLQDNGGDPLTVSANGAFTFATALAAGASYAVTVAASPAGQSCTVAGGTGTTSANVTSVAITCAALPPPPAGTTASDGFQRPDGALGASWTSTADGGLTISGDQAVGQDIDGNSGDLWAASSFNSDQFSQVTTSSTQLTGNQWLAAMVRGQASGMSGYAGLYDWNSGSPELMLFRRVNGDWDQLGASFATAALPAGSVLGLQATGPALALSVNGTVDITATDTDLAGGAPGLMTYESAHVAAWSGGNSAYTVGGTVSGLAGGSLVLRDNGGDALTVPASGSFTFATTLATGAAYAVTVASAPPGQACTVAGGAGTVATANVTGVAVSCATQKYTVGGTVSGLSGTVSLQDNGGDALAVSASGSFTFATALAYGASYAVTVAASPAGQSCTVSGGSGIVGAGNVTGVAVSCATATYSVGGSVTGLSGTVSLQDNGGDALAVSASGSFAFATKLTAGAAYSVAVSATPAGEACTVANGSGTIAAANVTSVAVTCTAQSYAVGGTVSGLSSGTVSLQDNGTDTMTVSANGAFTFPTQLSAGTAYAVTVSATPAGQACTVTGGTGAAGGASASAVTVTCAPASTYSIGGTISGLSGTAVLADNGGDNLSVSASGSFAFATKLVTGSPYAVTVASSPAGQSCTVAGGSGTVGSASVTSVTVTCTSSTSTTGDATATDDFQRANASTLGANWTATSDGSLTISGDQAAGQDVNGNSGDIWTAGTFTSDQFAQVTLSGTQLTGSQWAGPMVRAQGNGGDSGYVAIYFWNNGSPELMLFLREDGGWDQLGPTVSTSPLAAGAILGVSATGTTITVQLNGTTKITATDDTLAGGAPGIMTNAAAHAAAWAAGSAIPPPTYTVGGTISGLSGTVSLLDNGGDTLIASASGSFSFATQLTAGAAYNVTVATSPAAQSCSVAGGSGTVQAANVTGITVTCVTAATYSVGGAISGLSGTAVLADNGGDDLSVRANGSFTFATALASGTGYNVTVASSPAGQSCTVANGAGTMGTASVTSVTVTCAAIPAYAIGGTVAGLSGTVTLLDNGGDNLPVSANGSFSFPTHLATGASYKVTVGASPAGQTCTVASGSGTVNTAAVTSVKVTCVNGTTYTVGGTVSGLSGTVKLTDNGGDALTVAANGGFTFATPLAAGAAYAVAVSTQPSGQSCAIAGGSGTVGSANVTSVAVTCAATGGSGAMTTSYTTTSSTGVASYNYTSSIVNDGATEQIRVLQPSSPRAGVAHNFLIALPVEPGEGTTYGDGIATLAALDAQDQYNLTIVEPAFSIDPWYADSATDPAMQMETFMTSQLVPWIKATFATTGSEQVWLLGFSKSGLGAEDLILKHPSVYTLAAGWDFPADMTSYNQLGTSPQAAYGTNANYLSNYQLSQSFVTAHAAPFTTSKRLWLGGYYYFEYGVYSLFAPELANAKVPYDIEPATQMAHRWDSGWVAGALAALYADGTALG